MENTNSKHNFSIKKAFSFGWMRTKQHWKIMLVMGAITLLLAILPDLLAKLMGGYIDENTKSYIFDSLVSRNIYWVVYYVSIAISVWIGYNTTKMMFKITDGHKVKYEEMFAKATKNFWKYVGMVIVVTAVALIIGFILGYALVSLLKSYSNPQDSLGVLLAIASVLVIIAIYFSIRFMFAPYILIDKDTTIMESFRRSYKLTRGNVLKYLGLSLLCVVIVIAGLMALVVGVIPAIMVCYSATFYVYRKVIDGHVADEDKLRA